MFASAWTPAFALAMHIDTDEANAANLGNGAQGYIDGISTKTDFSGEFSRHIPP
jgi:hypothetical protein